MSEPLADTGVNMNGVDEEQQSPRKNGTLKVGKTVVVKSPIMSNDNGMGSLPDDEGIGFGTIFSGTIPVNNGKSGNNNNGKDDSSADTATVDNCSTNGRTTRSILAELYNCDPDDIPNYTAVPLRPSVQDYAWGIRGADSRVARYAKANGTIKEIDPDTPYAELWIGTHDKSPSVLYVESTSDSKNDEPSKTVSLEDAIGAPLPFLFKILSAGKALSIQAHPDKEVAARLHAKDPAHYGDANHKPEMAIALTPFEAMCGFRRIEEIAVLLKKHHEFASCLTEEAKLAVFLARTEEEEKKALQVMFHAFMSCDREVSERNLQLLLLRLQAEQSYVHPHPHDEPPWERKCARAVLRLSQQFPNDAGAMAPFFLNYLLIAPGESFFMAANEPHAYVAGEIIECMACSDNVVRAGLTPKFKDVDTLVEMLTYTTGGPSIDAGAPLYGDDARVLRYTPPVPEFEVLMLQCDPGDTITLKLKNIPAVFVIIEGTGTLGNDVICRPGRCYFHPADAKDLTFSVPDTKRGPLKVAIAHRNTHLELPTTFSRHTPRPSYANSSTASPYPQKSPRFMKDGRININPEYIMVPDWNN
jgi:mannose-6-phosphate isomerase